MQKLQGWAEQGATTLLITGAAGTITRRVQGSFPSATVTVYINNPPALAIQAISRTTNVVTVTVPTGANFIAGENVTIAGVTDASFDGVFAIDTAGPTSFTYLQVAANASSSGGTAFSTLRLASIYSDNSLTPKANPFTAGIDATWFFYAPNGRYDVRFSGAGIGAPFTLGDLALFDETTVATDITASPYFADPTGTADSTAAINAALTDAASSGGEVLVPHGTYKISSRLTVPANVTLRGFGRQSKLQSVIPNGQSELVRLGGDYAAIVSVWLSGTGQGDGSAVNGSRGIWIGDTPDYIAEGRVSFARVENCYIDQFMGNGISGDYWYAIVVKNLITDNTDANIFVQATCSHNYFSGNITLRSRYCGFDVNGNDNTFVGNLSSDNGTSFGIGDEGALNGFLVAAPIPDSGNRNTFTGNWALNNKGSGFLITAMNLTPFTSGPYGNVFVGNVARGHTNMLNNVGAILAGWQGGFVNGGGDSTMFEGNFADGNTFNFVVAGNTPRNASGCQVIANNSLNATVNADLTGAGKPSGVGYFFPGAPRVDGADGHPVDGLILRGNWDRNAASDAYRFDLAGALGVNVWNNATIQGNNSDTCGGFGYNMVSPNNFASYLFDGSNLSINAASGATNGWAKLGLSQNSTTPSVLHGMFFVTQNTLATSLTNFTQGVFGQVIHILVNDPNTTFDFTGTNLKGNFNSDYLALTGDTVEAIFDGTNWYCTVYHPGPATVIANVNQAVNKAQPVTQNGVLSGRITMHTGAGAADQIGANTTVFFSLTNDMFTTSRDMVVVNIVSGGTAPLFAAAYTCWALDGGASTIVFVIRNVTGTILDDQIGLDYEIRKR